MRLYYSFEPYDEPHVYVNAIKAALAEQLPVFEEVPFEIHRQSTSFMVFSDQKILWDDVRKDFDTDDVLPWLKNVKI